MNPTNITQWLANKLEAAEKAATNAAADVGYHHSCGNAGATAEAQVQFDALDAEAAILRALIAEREDVKRMDWMERELHDTPFDDDGRPGVVRASDGEAFYGDTLREAIDSALGEPPARKGGGQ